MTAKELKLLADRRWYVGAGLVVLLLLACPFGFAQRSKTGAAGKDMPKASRESGPIRSENLLFEAELQARSGMPPVVPTQGRDGELVGSGDGTIHGPKIRGKLRWSNFEKIGANLCSLSLTGVIETDDGASIDFDTRGYALLANPPRWSTAGAMRFETKDKRYQWLTNVLATWQGQFDPTTLRATMHVFAGSSAVAPHR